MHRSAALLCQDATSLHTLKTTLSKLGIEAVACSSQQEAMEHVLSQRCTTLVVDFDLPGAAEIAKLATLLEPPCKPVLLAITALWPASGEASQSGANCILYKPLQEAQIHDAFEVTRKTGKRDARKSPRFEITSVAWLDLASGTLPAVALNLSEHGIAVRTTQRLEPQANVPFRCVLPGTTERIHGYADVIWSDAEGRAGMFFSRLAPSARKHLKDWLRKQTRNQKSRKAEVGTVRALLQSPHPELSVTSKSRSLHGVN